MKHAFMQSNVFYFPYYFKEVWEGLLQWSTHFFKFSIKPFSV
jgi:hypothetical protein